MVKKYSRIPAIQASNLKDQKLKYSLVNFDISRLVGFKFRDKRVELLIFQYVLFYWNNRSDKIYGYNFRAIVLINNQTRK